MVYDKAMKAYKAHQIVSYITGPVWYMIKPLKLTKLIRLFPILQDLCGI